MIITRTCGMCQGGCKVKITVEDGKIVRVEPDKTSPKGRVCTRGALVPEFLYGSKRLTYPMIREGERGEGKFRRATWDEALDYAAELLKKTIDKYGAESLSTYLGRGIRAMPVNRMLFPEEEFSILRRLGSPNMFSSNSICWVAACIMAPMTTLGMTIHYMVQDIENSDYIFVWGKNPVSDDGPQTIMKKINKARERGAKLIVIDPRQIGTGEIADLWVPIIPGTDGALALAMHKIIIEEMKYDEEFVRDFTYGFDEFKGYLDTLTLEQLSEYCGVSLTQIRELTEMFCASEKATLVTFTGVEYQPSAVQNHRAVLALWALTGKIDVEGGIYLDARGLEGFKLKEIDENHKPVGSDEFPFFTKVMGFGQFSRFTDAVLDEQEKPLRSLTIVGGSPAITFPDSKRWREAYQKLDCLIVLDQYPTEDMRFADVVFPACTGFETYRPDMDENGNTNWLEPVIEPVGETRDDSIILGGIARRLGLGDEYPETVEELKEWIKGPTNIKMNAFHTGVVQHPIVYKKYKTGALRADGKPGFPTPSGKFELCSIVLEENGFVPYPEYTDIKVLPGMGTEEYPFVVTSGAKSPHRMGALGTNFPGAARLEPNPLMDISLEDANELGLKEGDWVRVISPKGEGKFKTHIGGMMKHCIHIPHGGGSAYMLESWRDGNANDLSSLDTNDPISGYVTMKVVACRIEKCE